MYSEKDLRTRKSVFSRILSQSFHQALFQKAFRSFLISKFPQINLRKSYKVSWTIMINKKTSNPCRVKFSELYMVTQILETFKSLFYYINLIHSFIFFIKNNKVLLSGVSSNFIVNKMWWLICGILFSWKITSVACLLKLELKSCFSFFNY